MLKIIKIFFLAAAVIIVSAWVFYNYQITAPAGADKTEVSFKIKAGEGVNQISQNLFNQGLIRSRFYFEVYAWAKQWEGRFVAGTHQLNSSMNIKEVTNQLTKFGSTESIITIIEGWNNKEISAYLEEQGFFKQADFLNEVGRNLSAYVQHYDFLKDKPEDIDLEGYLFPDTYRVYKNSTPNEIVTKILDNFGQKLTPDLRLKIANQGKTIFEILTLASIIEKEVMSPEDMKMVADVFYKRLEKNIPLQSDATVNYVTGKSLTRPTAEDLHFQSLYNTYLNPGLPPGPISNPGLKAIIAAIEPQANPYYYFLTDDAGQVYYAKTYDEHLQNKAKYLK